MRSCLGSYMGSHYQSQLFIVIIGVKWHWSFMQRHNHSHFSQEGCNISSIAFLSIKSHYRCQMITFRFGLMNHTSPIKLGILAPQFKTLFLFYLLCYIRMVSWLARKKMFKHTFQEISYNCIVRRFPRKHPTNWLLKSST